ncbi:MAG: hypothetical protein DRJ07_17235, partial [Bacteroidetes bacterium]
MKLNLIYLISIWLFLAACSGQNDDYSESIEAEYAPEMLAMSEQEKRVNNESDLETTINETGENNEKIEKKIIKTANIS